MKAQDFLKNKLELIAQKYNQIKIRCEYRPNTHTYLIEIIPAGLFETNEAYILDEMKLENEFEALFPQDEILFISEGSLNEIRIADFEISNAEMITLVAEEDSFMVEIEGYDIFLNIDNAQSLALAA